LEIKVFRSFSSELENYWRAAEWECKTFVFQTYDWCQAWYDKTGHDGSNLYIFVGIEDNEVKAIFPFCINSILSVKILSLMGGQLADYQAPLVKNETDIESIWTEFEPYLPKHDVLLLNRIPEPFSAVKSFIKGHIKTQMFQTAEIWLPAVKTNLGACISKRKIKDVRRYERRLSDFGHVSFDVCETFSPKSDIMDFVIEQKQLRYQKTGVRNILSDKKVENFYRELSVISSGISGVKAHLSSLRVDNNIIAAHLGLVYQSRFYYLTPAYLDGELSKFSPGSVLLHFLINWSIENKLEVFDLTIGDESYKGSWSNKRHYIYNILKPNSFSGWSFAYFIVALNFLKNNRSSRFLITRGIRFFRLLKVG
jgi:CelD/BcsL family acetyltransferase involved in cellulose biosynthesis